MPRPGPDSRLQNCAPGQSLEPEGPKLLVGVHDKRTGVVRLVAASGNTCVPEHYTV